MHGFEAVGKREVTCYDAAEGDGCGKIEECKRDNYPFDDGENSVGYDVVDDECNDTKHHKHNCEQSIMVKMIVDSLGLYTNVRWSGRAELLVLI